MAQRIRMAARQLGCTSGALWFRADGRPTDEKSQGLQNQRTAEILRRPSTDGLLRMTVERFFQHAPSRQVFTDDWARLVPGSAFNMSVGFVNDRHEANRTLAGAQ